MATDEQLMKGAAAGDMDAFGELVERHHQRALSVAYRFLGDATLAEDVAQDAFLRILGAAGRYKASAQFRTYLYNVIWHLCVDQYRRKRSLPLSELPVAADAADGPEQTLERAERSDRLRQAVQGLPARQRMALVLKHYEGLSYEEIARAMGCSAGAADSLLIRARRTLKDALQDLV